MSTSDTSMERMPVRSVMSDPVLCIVPDAPLEVALRMMAEAGVRHLPVVAGDRCVGLLHESDVLWRLWSTAGRDRASSGGVARTPVPLVEVTDTVRTATVRMAAIGSDAALVLDRRRIGGIVTTTNVVRYWRTFRYYPTKQRGDLDVPGG